MAEAPMLRKVSIGDYLRYYAKHYYCHNCGEHFTVWFRKKQQAYSVPCEKCECEVQP